MTRFILREPHRHLIVPRPDLGFFVAVKMLSEQLSVVATLMNSSSR